MTKLAAAISFFILVSCSYSDNSQQDNRADWGYQSAYSGSALQAGTWETSQREEIAEPLVTAIDIGNNILEKSSVALLPASLFTDSDSIRTEEEGNCGKIPKGVRAYDTRPLSYYNGSVAGEGVWEFSSEIDYRIYCLEDNISISKPVSVINGKSVLKETRSDNLTAASRYQILTADNLSISAAPYGGAWDKWDNRTFNGILEKRGTKPLNDNETVNYRLGMDMIEGSIAYRFDIYATLGKTYNKYIRFYHPLYGFVTADISWLEGEGKVPAQMLLTMNFKDNETCVFKPAELGSDKFNCLSK